MYLNVTEIQDYLINTCLRTYSCNLHDSVPCMGLHHCQTYKVDPAAAEDIHENEEKPPQRGIELDLILNTFWPA